MNGVSRLLQENAVCYACTFSVTVYETEPKTPVCTQMLMTVKMISDTIIWSDKNPEVNSTDSFSFVYMGSRKELGMKKYVTMETVSAGNNPIMRDKKNRTSAHKIPITTSR